MVALRCRAILFIQISQPIRAACNCNDYGGGRAPSQLDVAPVWCRVYEEVLKFQEDPSILLDREYNIFAGMHPTITATTKRYREHRRTAPMLDSLFGRNTMYDSVRSLMDSLLVPDDAHDETILILKAEAHAMAERLHSTNEGGCREFLPGGRYEDWSTNRELQEIMKKTPATADLVESSFGVLDDIISSNDNLSLHSGTTLATWRTNHTAAWIRHMENLYPGFVNMMVKMSIPAGKVLKKDSDARQLKAMKDQLQRMEDSAATTEEAEERKIHQLLDLEDQDVVTTIEELNSLLNGRTPANCTRLISQQVRMLVHRHGCRRGKLMAFSGGGNRYSHTVVRQLYKDLVVRLEKKEIKLSPARSIEEIIMRDRTVFRSGESTSVAKQRDESRREYYKKKVEECREKRKKAKSKTKRKVQGRKRGKRRKRGKYKKKTNSHDEDEDGRLNLVGRRVTMDGSVWHEDPEKIYTGLITKREWYRGRKRERVDGYEVKWCDGNKENWPYESLLPCLVPLNDVTSNVRESAITGAKKAVNTGVCVCICIFYVFTQPHIVSFCILYALT